MRRKKGKRKGAPRTRPPTEAERLARVKAALDGLGAEVSAVEFDFKKGGKR